MASTVAVIPAGLCAASTSTVGLVRTRSSRPGERTAANAARTVSCSIGPVAAPAPRNASTAASAVTAFCAWCAPNSGRKTSWYSPPRPCRRTCCPPTATRRSSTPNSVPSRATTASTSTARRTRESSAAGCWWASTAIESALMIPAFSVAIVPTSGPRYSAWSSATGVTTATRASTTLVASHVPPMPTSMTATSTGASANSA